MSQARLEPGDIDVEVSGFPRVRQVPIIRRTGQPFAGIEPHDLDLDAVAFLGDGGDFLERQQPAPARDAEFDGRDGGNLQSPGEVSGFEHPEVIARMRTGENAVTQTDRKRPDGLA